MLSTVLGRPCIARTVAFVSVCKRLMTSARASNWASRGRAVVSMSVNPAGSSSSRIRSGLSVSSSDRGSSWNGGAPAASTSPRMMTPAPVPSWLPHVAANSQPLGRSTRAASATAARVSGSRKSTNEHTATSAHPSLSGSAAASAWTRGTVGSTSASMPAE